MMSRNSNRSSKHQKRSARSSRRQNNERPEIAEEETGEKTLFCKSLARFIQDAADAIKDPFFYLTCGDHKKSLFYLTMLDIRKYCALLMGCGLVNCKRMSDGTIKVESSEGMWKAFLSRYLLDINGDGCSEASSGEFYFDALQDKDGCEKEEAVAKSTESRRRKRKVIVAIRIGAYKNKGESIVATAAINDGADPPGFCHKMRTAQRRLFNSIAPELSNFIFHEHIPAVEEWVKMDDVFGKIEDPPAPLTDPEQTPKRGDSVSPTKPSATPSPAGSVKGDRVPPAKPSVTPSPAGAVKNNAGNESIKPTGQLKSTPEVMSPPPIQKNDSSRVSNLLSFFGVKIDDTKPQVRFTPRALDLVKELEQELGYQTVNSKDDSNEPAKLVEYRIPTPKGVTKKTKKPYDLLASLDLDMLSRNDTDVDLGKWKMQNLLREMVSFMEEIGEDVAYDTANSKYEHKLLKVSTRKSDKSCPDIKQVLKKLFDMGNSTQLIGAMMEYLLDNHKDETLNVLREERLIPKVI